MLIFSFSISIFDYLMNRAKLTVSMGVQEGVIRKIIEY